MSLWKALPQRKPRLLLRTLKLISLNEPTTKMTNATATTADVATWMRYANFPHQIWHFDISMLEPWESGCQCANANMAQSCMQLFVLSFQPAWRTDLARWDYRRLRHLEHDLRHIMICAILEALYY
jgi:hypothetical protein